MAKLALLRHGESQANAANVYTGWNDVPLTDKGRRQAWAAGEKLKEVGDFHPLRSMVFKVSFKAREFSELAVSG